MYNYQLTPKLLQNLIKIERLYGQLESLRIPKKLEINLERDNLIKSSYISNSIEGNPLSLPQVTNLLLRQRVPSNRNELEVKNYFDILSTLDKYVDRPFSLDSIQDIHKRLMAGTDDTAAGKIRNTKVIVGGYVTTKSGKVKLKVKHEPPFHKQRQIRSALQKSISWMNQPSDIPSIIKIGMFHHDYVYIHPFEDGNGRTCRLITALLFLQHNYQINKYFVLDDFYDINRFQYSDRLGSADKGEKTHWLEYFTDGVKFSLESALDRVDSVLRSVAVEQRPTQREYVVLEFLKVHPEVTSYDVVQELAVSRQQAHRLLRGLVEKGFVKKKGTTKSSYYVMIGVE